MKPQKCKECIKLKENIRKLNIKLKQLLLSEKKLKHKNMKLTKELKQKDKNAGA